MHEKLTQVLGDDGLVELREFIREAQPNATWKEVLVGSIKSRLIWLGAMLVALPELWPLIADQVQEILPPGWFLRASQMVGLVVIYLRYKTNQSVSEKGKPS